MPLDRKRHAVIAALWSLAAIGLLGWPTGAAAQLITEFPIPSGATPNVIAVGPDGALWFTENSANQIGRITTAGVITEYPTLSSLGGITAGPDGALWFTAGNSIGRMTTNGVTTNAYPIPTANSNPYAITAGPDGNLWFTESGQTKIGQITTAGVITEFNANTYPFYPLGITRDYSYRRGYHERIPHHGSKQ
jgi:virginiamycin B lyase